MTLLATLFSLDDIHKVKGMELLCCSTFVPSLEVHFIIGLLCEHSQAILHSISSIKIAWGYIFIVRIIVFVCHFGPLINS